MRALLALLAVGLWTTPAAAQVTPARPLVVMNLAAHPDDEDGATLAYYRGNQGAIAHSVFYTRGEGGQNEIGPELYEHLGVIRTAETEAAAGVLGTRAWYLNYFDFGFSKWAGETFAEWSRPRTGFWDLDDPVRGTEAGRAAVTASLVRLIRRLRPDVIFTNHDTVTVAPRAQHGHHQVVGLSAWDAFELAGDPSYRPEQLREPGVQLWQPRRLFVRSRSSGTRDVAIATNSDCGSGEACADRAVRAAMLHRSQGFDLLAPRFFRRDTTYFVLYREAPGVEPLPANASDLAAGLTLRPWSEVPVPPDAGPHGEALPPIPGLAASDDVAVPGESVSLTWTPLDGEVAVYLTGRAQPVASAPGTSGSISLRIPDDARLTLPAARQQYGRERSVPPVQVVARAHGTASPAAHLTHASRLNLEIAPPVWIDIHPRPIRLQPGDNSVRVALRVADPLTELVTTRLRVDLGSSRSADVVSALVPAGEEHDFRVKLPQDVPPGSARVIVEAEPMLASAPAEPYVETRPAAILPEIRVAEGLRVGFVRSYDLTTEDALRAMGADVVPLDSLALATSDFAGLHTIVLDIRAYLVRRDLRQHNGRLLDWVRRGGHLVVTYQKTFEWNAGAADPTQPEGSGVLNPDFAPYPLLLGRDRVVREDAPVRVLEPDHALFRRPNGIAPADWDGWVQERGLYFPETYDDRYVELLGMNDPGEPELRGAVLLADVGDGTYAYSPLVWYRQLEALNPGAWRLFANLVSLPLGGQ